MTSGKSYVGQAVSHILNHKRYRPYGSEGRFRCHISEAYSKKQNQSHYLNNAIRKYGPVDFELEILELCSFDEKDKKETEYIEKLNTLYPNGYNLRTGGMVFQHTDESKKRVSQGVLQYYSDKSFARFKDVTHIDDESKRYIRPLNRDGNQYGWYVYIDGKKRDFGGSHISLDESYERAIEFIDILRKKILAKHLDAGNSLEPTTTTS